MLRFCGFDLELEVDSVLQRRCEEPVVCSATDPGGRRWLIVESERPTDEVPSWLCAPASPRAVQMVESGRAAAADVVLHSFTGWVEVVEMVNGHSVPERRVRCSELAGSGLLAAV
jgi:hypothetical protein